MKNFFSILTLAVVLMGAGSIQAKLNVVATTADFAALVREVGGNLVEVTTLAKPTEDPHFVDARPSFIVKLNKAHAVVEGGAELEIGWLPSLLDSARNPKLAKGASGYIDCHEGVPLLEVPTTLDRSKGDIHAAGNPHYLMDPANAKIVAGHIAEAFCKLDADACETYRANLKRFAAALEAKLAEWGKTLAPFQGRHIVAYHNSWPYFSHRFGVKIDLFLEPKPGIPPTPTHLTTVIKQMKEQDVRVILTEPFLNRKTAESVARATGATVLDVTQFPGGLTGTEGGYLQLMDYLVGNLAKALGK